MKCGAADNYTYEKNKRYYFQCDFADFFLIYTFYKQIAIGTGAGLRLDFNYFLLRADLGIQARDTSREEGDRWVLGRHSINSDRYAFNFAIGYPF